MDVLIATAAGAHVEHVTFAYDAFDRRVAKTTAGSNPSTRYTVYDGQNPLADFDASGNMTAVHIHADAVDALLASVTPSGGVSWYLTDNQGSVRSVLNAAGNVVDRITYDAFGGVASETNPSAGGRFKYTAREWDGEIGLQYNRARYYDPSTGRWISQDPIGFAGGDADLCRYIGSSPSYGTWSWRASLALVIRVRWRRHRRLDGPCPEHRRANLTFSPPGRTRG